jgi:hypothetical protein
MPKGSKRPRGFFSKPPKWGIKTYAKRGQRATWVFNKPPARGIKTYAKSQLKCLENLSNKKSKNLLFQGKVCCTPGSNWYKKLKRGQGNKPVISQTQGSAVTYIQFLQYPDWNRTSKELRTINP